MFMKVSDDRYPPLVPIRFMSFSYAIQVHTIDGVLDGIPDLLRETSITVTGSISRDRFWKDDIKWFMHWSQLEEGANRFGYSSHD